MPLPQCANFRFLSPYIGLWSTFTFKTYHYTARNWIKSKFLWFLDLTIFICTKNNCVRFLNESGTFWEKWRHMFHLYFPSQTSYVCFNSHFFSYYSTQKIKIAFPRYLAKISKIMANFLFFVTLLKRRTNGTFFLNDQWKDKAHA